jgi:hypothetical protein
MPRRKPQAHELTTEDVVRKMFPKKAREAVRLEAEKAQKPGKDSTKDSTKKESS